MVSATGQGLDRPGRIGDPLAPRPGIQRRRNASQVQRQHLLRRCHAGTAVGPDRPIRLDSESGEPSRNRSASGTGPTRRRCRWSAHCGRRGCARRRDRPARPRPGTAARPAHPATPHRRRSAPPRPRRRAPASRPGRTTTFPGSGEGSSVVSGNPAAVQAAIPPSSTRTSRSPAHRSSHQARAALLPSASSYATTELSSLIPHRRNASCSAPAPAADAVPACRRRPEPPGPDRGRQRRRQAGVRTRTTPPAADRRAATARRAATGRGADTFRKAASRSRASISASPVFTTSSSPTQRAHHALACWESYPFSEESEDS